MYNLSKTRRYVLMLQETYFSPTRNTGSVVTRI